MRGSRFVAVTSVLTGSAVTFRLLKHAVAGPVQFVNLPLSMAMVAGYLAGPASGFTVGLASFVLSDMLLGLGVWTIYDALASALVGMAWGYLRGVECGATLFTLSYLSALAYDLATSVAFYSTFMGAASPLTVLAVAVTGLFVPVAGGSLYAVGPVTEALTALLTSVVVRRVRQVVGEAA
ncbi:MAG: hypothetical protein DRJ56_07345 [Thermoprotei archaeon]|nr:MAG: hypothetical protein DRJ56_07345 [Thermoprotei archaeon]